MAIALPFSPERIYTRSSRRARKQTEREAIDQYDRFEDARNQAVVRKAGSLCAGCFLNRATNPLAPYVTVRRPARWLLPARYSVDVSRPGIHDQTLWAERIAKLLTAARDCTGPIRTDAVAIDLKAGERHDMPFGSPPTLSSDDTDRAVCGAERTVNPELFMAPESLPLPNATTVEHGPLAPTDVVTV